MKTPLSSNYADKCQIKEEVPSHKQEKDLDCSEGPGLCAHLLTLISVLLILVSLPLSLMFVVKVVQEYERAVIFRLGRLLSGGARGPGVFFIIPCVDIYEKIDMRTQTFDVPPQEVWIEIFLDFFLNSNFYYRS